MAKWKFIVVNMKYNAFDSETIKGYARIVATKQKYWKVHSFEDAVKPLIIEGTHYGVSFFCWNLNYDMRAILKYLPHDILKELADMNEVEYNDYKIFYIEGKICSITYLGFEKSRRITFYDITQFYNYQSLDSMAEKYLGRNKIDNPITNAIKNNQDVWPKETMERFFKDHYDQIGEYCQEDGYLTAKLAELMGKTIKDVFNIDIRTFTSKATIAEKLSFKKGEYPVNFGDNSIKYTYSRLAFRGGMFDCWRRGFFPNGVTEVDISSAYPSVQWKLPHWGLGKFYDITKESEIQEDDYYGWFLVGFDCPYIPYDTQQNEMWEEYHNDEKVTVIVPDRKKIYYPTGYRYQIITLVELNFLKKYGYEYNIEDGFVWRQIPGKILINAQTKKVIPNPFAWIKPMYDKKALFKKKYGKKSIEYMLVKIAINGCYGKTCQSVGTHVMQDFRYASYITAETRVKLISFILDRKLEDDVIMIATDGIYLEGIQEFDNLGTGLGSWDISHFDSGLFMGNGLYQLRGEYSKLKLRGYGSGRYTFKDYEPIEFDLIGDLRKHKHEQIYLPRNKAMHKKKPNSLKMCLNFLALSKDDINIFAHRDKAITCFSDKSKKWSGIKTIGDLTDNNFRGIRLTVDEIEENKP